MAQQFEVQATGLNGIPYRIEIYNDNYGGTTITQLDGDKQFIRFEGGQRERVGVESIWGKEVRINVRTNEDLSPLFGLEDRDAEVRVYRTDTSLLVWKGFILTDLFQDEPLTDLPGVELRAVDGLTTLEGDSFDALSLVSDSDIGDDTSFISYTDLFTGVLSTLYDNPLDVEFAVEWYPDASGQLSSNDNPLRYSGARPDVYYDSEDGEWFDQQSTLEDALKSQGLEIRQSVIGGELTWLVAQPTALSASSVKTWRCAPDGTEDAASPFTRDLSLDLSGADTSRPTREFERRSGSVSVTHDHKPIDNLVPNGGFENVGDWQITGSGTNPSYYAVREKYSNLGKKLPPQTQNNKYALVFKYDSQGTDFPLSQDLGKILGLPQGAAFTLRQTFLQNVSIFGGADEFSVRLNIGQYWLKEETRKVKKDADPGTGSVFVGEINSKIPSGSIIPVTEDPASLDDSDNHSAKATIRLTEPVTPGDGELTGEISSSLKSGQIIRYPAWTTTQSRLPIAYWKTSQGVFAPVSVRAPTVLEDGTEISGQSKIEYGAKHAGTTSFTLVHAVLDDVQLSVTRQGRKLKESTTEASVPAAGQSRNVQVLLSSGPTLENESRVKGLAPGDFAYNATDWGIGVGGGSLSLAGLQARERLRYLREHLERQQLTVYARDKSPVVTGEEIVQFDGKTWRIAEFSSDPASGEIGLTLIQHADAGTTDLSIETVRDTDGGGTSGGGGTTPAIGGGGGAVSVVQNEVVAFPANGTPDRFRVSDTSAPEPQIQSAIDLVANNGGGSVVLGSAVVNGGYDPTSVTFDPSVLMEVDGQRGVGYNVVAYGAAGDGSSDDYPAFEATHNQAQAAAPGGQFTAGAKQRITIPQPTDGGSYLLGQMWVLEISSLEVVGGGKYGTRISNHSSFDSSIDEALISIGPLPSDTDPTVSSVVFRRLNVDGRGQEVSALRAHYDFSLNVENCTLRAGGYNQDGLGREVAGLHFRSGKNAFVRECQIASSGGHGILVDDRGDSGNNFTNHLEIRECLITENIANIRIKNGGFDTHITGGIIGGIDDNDAGPGDGHNLIDEGFGQLTVSDVWFVGGEYGVVKFGANRMQTKIENVRFSGIDRQSVADMGGNFSYTKVTDCTFDECGLDHDPNGSYNEDYTASGKVADIHFNDSFGSRYHLTNNDHIPDVPDQFPNRHSAVLEVADSYSTLSDAADAEHLIADNSTLGAGYRAVNGDEVQDDQAHYIDDSRLIFGGLGQESAGTGNKPTATDWEEGDIVENTDDDTLWLLLQDGSSWVRVDSVDSKVFVDLGNDGVPDIDPLEQIATTNDPQSVWSAGPNTEELLIDGNPLAYRAEDETITGQWQYEQEIDWTSQIEGVGYEGYRRIPVDSASQTEYILISKLDGNGNNQRLTADFYIGRTTGSSVNDHGQIRVYWNQSGAGSNRNFATETLMDVEGASEVFDARPVEVTYNGDQWAAVEVSVGFGNIRWRTLQPHHTGNYSLSVVESKSAANISNVTFWGDSSAGSLGRQELHVQRLQHDASRSHSFTSGFTGSGWTLETLGPDGKPDYMEAGHMVLRGTLRVRELILEQLRVRKGVQIISSGGGKLERVEASPTSSAVDANLGEFNAWDITGVDTSTNTVTVDNSTVSPDPSTLNGGQGVLIDGSAGNDDNYTVSSVTDNGDGTSDITMNESVSDSTADGRVWEATQQRFFFEAPNDTASAPGLQAGDRILAQRFDASNQTVVAQVRAVVERQFSTHEWAVTVSTNYTVPDIGQETEGYEFAVVASATGSRQSILVDSPFQPGREVLDGLADFDDWDNRADFLRMNQGNLNSRYDYTQEAYGMAAGDPDGVWISADDTKGVRMVDNTQGNQTVRAQLQGPSLTLGDTADDHIKIDPAGGLQMINDQGTEVARLNGTLLRLGSSGQIEFDPTASPEAKIQGTLQMGSGDIRAQTEGENSLLINGATSFSNGPTETQQDAVTQSFSAVSDSTRTSFLNSSTNPEYTHRLKITVDVASGATDGAEVRVDIDDASANDLTGELFVVQPGNATTRSVTFVPNSNSVDVSTRAIANGPNMTTVDVSYTLYDMPPLTEMTAVGMRVWKSGSKYITLGDGKIESDEYYFGSGYQLKRKGTDLFWIAPDGTETQIN